MKRKKLRVTFWHGKQEMQVVRARVSRAKEESDSTTPTSRAVGAVQSALSVGGCGREIVVLAMSPLEFAKAGSAATMPQQEKSNSADVQWGRVINTASKLGPRTQTDRGTCPGVGL